MNRCIVQPKGSFLYRKHCSANCQEASSTLLLLSFLLHLASAAAHAHSSRPRQGWLMTVLHQGPQVIRAGGNAERAVSGYGMPYLQNLTEAGSLPVSPQLLVLRAGDSSLV